MFSEPSFDPFAIVDGVFAIITESALQTLLDLMKTFGNQATCHQFEN
jgi:hypothetical protein